MAKKLFDGAHAFEELSLDALENVSGGDVRVNIAAAKADGYSMQEVIDAINSFDEETVQEILENGSSPEEMIQYVIANWDKY